MTLNDMDVTDLEEAIARSNPGEVDEGGAAISTKQTCWMRSNEIVAGLRALLPKDSTGHLEVTFVA